jgi:hypothetical protein
MTKRKWNLSNDVSLYLVKFCDIHTICCFRRVCTLFYKCISNLDILLQQRFFGYEKDIKMAIHHFKTKPRARLAKTLEDDMTRYLICMVWA